MPSIKKNFAYKSALTISTYLMGFITFPYVARVLEVDRIGLVNFVDNTVNYFLLFATMGIGLLGVREIAAIKNNKEELNSTYSKLLGINLLFTLLTIIVYLALVVLVPKFNQYSELFYIGTAKILFTAFLCEWFFTGIEDFKYITIRSLLIKAAYVVLVFIFIKSEADYKLYFILTVGTVVLNAIVNSIYLSKYIRIDFKSLAKLHYLKKNCVLGIYSLMTSMYLTFNVMFLGFVSDNIQVGYYTTAFKIYTVVLSLFTAFTNVMLPRMSSLLAEGQHERFQELMNKSFRVVCTFSIPLIIYCVIMAPQLIYVVAGKGYEGSITPMRLLMPAALFVGIAQVLALQVLAPMKKDRQLFTASIIGAIVSLMINFALVIELKSIGSAIVLLVSEVTVTSYYVVYVIKHGLMKVPFNSISRNILLSIIPASLALFFLIKQGSSFILIPLSGITFLGTWYLLKRLFFKNSMFV